jgi:hypothetical protein
MTGRALSSPDPHFLPEATYPRGERIADPDDIDGVVERVRLLEAVVDNFPGGI